MVNYAINPDLLRPYVPFKTELDFKDGVCFVSIVGFMFSNTRLKGIRIPFHSNFEEVNLRFYVRHKDGEVWKRGTVFIKEIVPKPAIAFVAKQLYNEPYETLQMNHSIDEKDDVINVAYSWKRRNWDSISITAGKDLLPMGVDSEEEFICEHYWGYNKKTESKTFYYGVEHPRWQVYKTLNYKIDVDFEGNYGSTFSLLKNEKPTSVFLAEGSEIIVRDGRVL